MSSRDQILNDDAMQGLYGPFYTNGANLQLDRTKVPDSVWPQLPYAEFWGIADDWTRESLVKAAPPEVQRNLKHAVTTFEDALEEWLLGPEADRRNPSDEYVAFAAMIMAADSI
jgi:hypothetical protein